MIRLTGFPPASQARLAFIAGLVLVLCSTTLDAGHRNLPSADCPQPRFTGQAPDAEYRRVNPLNADRATIKAGKKIYHRLANPSCEACHGKKGEGNGPLASQFDPRPRNFACAKTVDGIPDGQLRWIIQNGSPGTAMPPFGYFSDEEIWQLVIYLRELSGH